MAFKIDFLSQLKRSYFSVLIEKLDEYEKFILESLVISDNLDVSIQCSSKIRCNANMFFVKCGLRTEDDRNEEKQRQVDWLFGHFHEVYNDQTRVSDVLEIIFQYLLLLLIVLCVRFDEYGFS